MAKQLRRGVLSHEEKKFIIENGDIQTDAWIAEKLNRSEQFITRSRKVLALQEKIGLTMDKKGSPDEIQRAALRGRDDWPLIQKQYSEEEVKLFEFYWIRMCRQMPDMTHTEEMQAIKLIHMEMLMNRTLQSRKKVLSDIDRCDRLIDNEWKKAENRRDASLIEKLEQQKDLLNGAEQARTKEFNDIMEKYGKLMQAIKGTRDQRFAKVESSKHSFADWLRIHNEEKARRAESQETALMAKATQLEVGRLSDWHKYEDGKMDQPLLTPETVRDEDESWPELEELDSEES